MSRGFTWAGRSPHGPYGADWIERPNRASQEQPQQLIQALSLQPTDVVADMGTGYLSFQISAPVPPGKVVAIDIQPEMLNIIQSIKRQKTITNVKPVLGSITNLHLPVDFYNLELTDTKANDHDTYNLLISQNQELEIV